MILQVGLVVLLQNHLVGLVDHDAQFVIVGKGSRVRIHVQVIGLRRVGHGRGSILQWPWPQMGKHMAGERIADECGGHHHHSLYHPKDVLRGGREFAWYEDPELIALSLHPVALHLSPFKLVEEAVVGTDVESGFDGMAVAEVEGHAGKVVLRLGYEYILALLHHSWCDGYHGFLQVVARKLYGSGILQVVLIHSEQITAIGVGHHLLAIVSHRTTAQHTAIELHDKPQFMVELDGALIDADAVGRTVEITIFGGFGHVALHFDAQRQHALFSPQVDSHLVALFHVAILISVGRENLEFTHHDGLHPPDGA